MKSLKTCRVDRIQCLKIKYAEIINAYFRLCVENSCLETLVIPKAQDIATSYRGVQFTLSLLVVSISCSERLSRITKINQNQFKVDHIINYTILS